MITTIRNLGGCPCPRCLMPLKMAHELGTPRDRWWRQYRQRSDDLERQKKVQKARKAVYSGMVAIDNKKHVENLLKPESLVLTEVSLRLIF
jgi:hypothetical protein